MKILMFNNEFPPLGGGTGTVNFELFKIFKHFDDLKIDLVTSTEGKQKEFEQFSANIRIFKYPVSKKHIHHASNIELIIYALKASIAGFKLLKKTKYDFVFVWSTVPSGLPALLLNFFKKIPFIVRVGGPDIPGFEKRYSVIYKIISPFIKNVWKKSDLIIAKCETEKKMIKAINSELNIKIIYNGVDIDFFKPKKQQIKNNINAICTARLIKRKGQYTLIDAVSKLVKDGIKIHINLVGDGDEKENYIKYTKEKGVSELINFSTYVPRNEMPEKYKEADLFILPSYNEGMSNALLEAMSCGLPVIVTETGGTKELVNHKNGYIFNAGDSNALANILKHLFENKEKLPKLGQNSRKKAEAFIWKNIAKEYLNLFNTITK